MAKKRKKVTLKAPELGWNDKLCYAGALLAVAGLDLLLWKGAERARTALLYGAVKGDPVLAVSSPQGELLTVPLLLFFTLFSTVLLCYGAAKKIPVFGKKGITYGPPAYREVYPLFGKQHRKVKRAAEEEEFLKSVRKVCAGVLAVCLLLCACGLFCGSCFVADETFSVRRYGLFLREKTAEQPDSFTFSTLPRGFYGLEVASKTGKTFRFRRSDFVCGDDEMILFLLLEARTTVPEEAWTSLERAPRDQIVAELGLEENHVDHLLEDLLS